MSALESSLSALKKKKLKCYFTVHDGKFDFCILDVTELINPSKSFLGHACKLLVAIIYSQLIMCN